jgi:chromate reductase
MTNSPPPRPHDVAVLVGSLRKNSYSGWVAQALAELAPPTLKLRVVPIGDLPLYNQDTESPGPAPWVAFRDAMRGASAVLFVTPEYNRSVPGVLKNAIDVGSRPYGKSSFLGKPSGIVSNSPGPLGGVNAAKHLQQILPGITGPILQQPEIYLNAIGDAFDEAGDLTKESLRPVLQQYIDAFAGWVDRLKTT